jgi:hypothetical protein
VRLYADINGYEKNYSCLCSQGNKERPWGTTHETGDWARFRSKEEAVEAAKRFFGYESSGIYKRAQVFFVSSWACGEVVFCGEPSRTPVGN